MKHKNSTYRYKSKVVKNRRLYSVLLVVLALAVATATFVVLRHRNNATTVPASTSSSNGSSTPVDTKGSQPSTTTDKGTTPTSPPATTPPPISTDPPKKPYGNFVSNHAPHLADAEQSTCITSPGATCNISFSKDGITKSLGDKKTDSDGTAYWSWNVGSTGLSEGIWSITATATLNGKTQSTSDTLNLTVTQ